MWETPREHEIAIWVRPRDEVCMQARHAGILGARGIVIPVVGLHAGNVGYG